MRQPFDGLHQALRPDRLRAETIVDLTQEPREIVDALLDRGRLRRRDGRLGDIHLERSGRLRRLHNRRLFHALPRRKLGRLALHSGHQIENAMGPTAALYD